MIWLNMFFGPPLLLAGLAFRRDWREAVLPLGAGILLVAAWGGELSSANSTAAGLLWMVAPGVAGLLLFAQAARTSFGGVAQGLYAAVGLSCVIPTLLFAFIFYALWGDV